MTPVVLSGTGPPRGGYRRYTAVCTGAHDQKRGPWKHVARYCSASMLFGKPNWRLGGGANCDLYRDFLTFRRPWSGIFFCLCCQGKINISTIRLMTTQHAPNHIILNDTLKILGNPTQAPPIHYPFQIWAPNVETWSTPLQTIIVRKNKICFWITVRGVFAQIDSVELTVLCRCLRKWIRCELIVFY